MKRLLIVESPSKIKTINKFLGSDYKIMSTMGHIKDLPQKEMGVTRDPIAITYVTMDKKEKTIAELCKAAQGVDEVYLATDPDREGEIIAWHVFEEIKKLVKNPKHIYRITFNEITKSAIIEALEHPASIDMKKVSAQQARRILDRWVGYEVSPLLSRKITRGLSAGRVQSVALKMICDREDAIRIFKPEEYWSIHGSFKNAEGQVIAPLVLIDGKKAEITNQETAQSIVQELEKESFSIAEVNDKIRAKNPLAPFMTSTLQQAAYNKLGYAVKKTMQIAQNLYEGIPLEQPNTPVALITYMRTDSLRISETALTAVRGYVQKKYGKEYLPDAVNVYEKKSKTAAQDAHEAIRPVDVTITPEYVAKFVEPQQAKLYELIWNRFVASQMTPASYAQRQVVIKGQKYTFRATGSTLLFDGFLKVYAEEEDESESEEKVKIPEKFAAKMALQLKKIDPKQHFTQPPPRFTESSLVKELEKEGIGRPSTFASIITTICAREYTTLDKKKFVPTELGMLVTKMLNENFSHIMNTKFTALMEEDLDKIADGELERDTLLNSFYENFEKDLLAFKGAAKSVQQTEIVCPECKNHKLVIRFGKAGEFVGCPGFPECPFTSNFIRNESDGSIMLVEKEKPQTLDINCPECKKPLREMMGRFGKFISCSGYPDCKYIQQNKAGFPCPQDNGAIVQRKWRGGTFWSCKNYPECKYALFGEIEETPCPLCKAPALLKKVDAKTGAVALSCADKKCGYKN